MNDHFDHYKRAPSRDRSRDPSMDRYSRSSRQQSVVRQMADVTSSRGPSPAPTPTNMIKRSVSRQRTPISTPTPSLRIGQDASFSNGSSNDNISLQRRMATPVRVLVSNESCYQVCWFVFANWLVFDQEMGNVGNGNIPGFGLQATAATNSVEEMLMRQRLGQEIPHFNNGPKRTESLYISPARKKEKVNFILLNWSLAEPIKIEIEKLKRLQLIYYPAT